MILAHLRKNSANRYFRTNGFRAYTQSHLCETARGTEPYWERWCSPVQWALFGRPNRAGCMFGQPQLLTLTPTSPRADRQKCRNGRAVKKEVTLVRLQDGLAIGQPSG